MIYIIITTSIHNWVGVKNYEFRKQRYITAIGDTLRVIHSLGLGDLVKPIIVENNGDNNTYMNGFSCDVVYTNHNVIKQGHKGVNEMMDLQHVMNKYNVGDEDMVIKLTGRYRLLDDVFLKSVIAGMETYDAFLKFYNVCTFKFEENNCVLGLFALRAKYLKLFRYSNFRLAPETEFAMYVCDKVAKEKIVEVQDLHLECCFADDLRILVY
jgi:hypothetical protein